MRVYLSIQLLCDTGMVATAWQLPFYYGRRRHNGPSHKSLHDTEAEKVSLLENLLGLLGCRLL